jgi:hypothetical protein
MVSIVACDRLPKSGAVGHASAYSRPDGAELERLAAADIIGTVPKPKRQYGL